MDFFRKSTTWLIIAGLVTPLSPALAQTSGQFTLAGSFAYSYEQIQHGGTTFTGGNLEGGATIVSSGQGSLFPEGQNFLQSCVVFSEESARGLDLKGPCTLTETKEYGEDRLFFISIRKQGGLGDASSGGTGRMNLVGGTGKYAGITGQCSYETQYLTASTLVTTAECAWRQP
ncbi:MAG: hypothetical protein F4162_05960 [Synechococcus sp. SB0676_bin_10]|uniref:Uncharacterized protein n=1 Tax=Synechococcus sp. SB0676_bin_10 TaxID=2604869 RepID=A0A6B1F6B7_9SYNE|nr:hypothetical protein [Cyanobacteria bacterium MAG IRC3_bin_20]MDE0646956.1 hypothetical protein [Cyanobacteria bacterium MAG IRC4_bin_6]MYG38521.1 hypothetical protein [Synechococcus sp. SB0676_bin_10]